MGLGAAEEYENRTFYGVFEGDWFALFGIVAAVACVVWALRLIRDRS